MLLGVLFIPFVSLSHLLRKICRPGDSRDGTGPGRGKHFYKSHGKVHDSKTQVCSDYTSQNVTLLLSFFGKKS
jgi:hypothetical protein